MKLLKQILCSVLSTILMMTATANIAMANDDIKVVLDGEELSFDVPPQIINDRTMVPLRAIFEALGASVDWDQDTQTVTSTKNDVTIKLTIDSSIMYVNDSIVTLDSPACIVDERTLVPVRAISEAYNTTVDWNGDNKTVTISSDNSSSFPSTTETPKEIQSSQTENGSIELNREYGPMVVKRNYSTGEYWMTNKISSLVFTKCEKTSIGDYQVSCSMQGVVDGDMADVKVYFYDSNNRVLDEVWFFHDVAPNVEYNVLIEKFVDEYVIDNAVRIEFYSYTGEKAVMENQTVVNDNGNSVNNADDKDNVTNNDSLSGYDKLKNELINKGTYRNGSYSAISTYKSLTYFFNYNPQKEELGIMFESVASSGGTYTVLCTPKKDENTGAFFVVEFSSGDEYSWLGEFADSKLIKISSSNSYFDDIAQKYVKLAVSGIETALIELGFDVSIDELGMSVD